MAEFKGLIKMLESEGVHGRRNAAYLLGETRDRNAVQPLIGALFDHDWEVRMAAAWGLGHIGDASAVHALNGALGDRNSNVRALAVWALGEIGDAAAVSPLTGLLNDSEWDIRKNVVTALGKIGDGSVSSLLVGLLKDEDAAVKSTIAKTLGEFGDIPVVVPGLIGTLNDPSEHVREDGVMVLGWIVEKSDSMENLQEFEGMLEEGSAVLKRERAKALVRVDSNTLVGRLQDRIEGKKMELAPKKDLLLMGRPKPPKDEKKPRPLRTLKSR